VVFLEGEFLRKGDIDDIDRFFEVDESHEGTLNPDQEDKSDLLSSRSVPSSECTIRTDSMATFLCRSQRENIPRCCLILKGKLSCVLHKRQMNLKIIKRL